MSIARYCMVHCEPNAEQKQTVNRLSCYFDFFPLKYVCNSRLYTERHKDEIFSSASRSLVSNLNVSLSCGIKQW